MTRRTYNSALRTAQAAETRRRILTAAGELFASDGYANTSLARIADAAGVSLETVKANGPKSALILGAFDQAFTGEEGDGAIHERDLGASLLAVPDEELLPNLVAFIAGANERIARLWIALLDASMGDPAVERELEALQERRRSDFRASMEGFRERGLARRPGDDEAFAAAMQFLVSPSSYVQLVLDSGWSMQQYREWLVDTIERTIFTP
ncbi:MAG: TetR/AcrR family transcriptional regulator [Protaetiibacter sp.]